MEVIINRTATCLINAQQIVLRLWTTLPTDKSYWSKTILTILCKNRTVIEVHHAACLLSVHWNLVALHKVRTHCNNYSFKLKTILNLQLIKCGQFRNITLSIKKTIVSQPSQRQTTVVLVGSPKIHQA